MQFVNAAPLAGQIDVRVRRRRGGVVPVRLTDESRPRDRLRQLRREDLMSVVVALAAFPVLAVVLMALSRAEDSLSHVTERTPARH